MSATQELFTALGKANNRLEHLTPNDWSLIIDKAAKQTFHKGDKLIEQGLKAKMIFLVMKGNARVEVNSMIVGKVGKGDICGEMSFLENSYPSASVIAEEEVEAYAVHWVAFQDLFQLYPHVASRFYRSLAINLSRRLREKISSAPK